MILTALTMSPNRIGPMLLASALLLLSMVYATKAQDRITDAQISVPDQRKEWRPSTWGRAAMVAALTVIVGDLLGRVAFFGTLIGAAALLQHADGMLPDGLSDRLLNDPTDTEVAVLAAVAELASAITIMVVLIAAGRVLSVRLSIRWALIAALLALAVEWAGRHLTDSNQPWNVWTATMAVPVLLIVRWRASQLYVVDDESRGPE